MKLTVYIEKPCICQHKAELEFDASEVEGFSHAELSKFMAENAREAFFEECSYGFELVDDDGNVIELDYVPEVDS